MCIRDRWYQRRVHGDRKSEMDYKIVKFDHRGRIKKYQISRTDFRWLAFCNLLMKSYRFVDVDKIILKYKDPEDDEITVNSDDDLVEAYLTHEGKELIKFFVIYTGAIFNGKEADLNESRGDLELENTIIINTPKVPEPTVADKFPFDDKTLDLQISHAPMRESFFESSLNHTLKNDLGLSKPTITAKAVELQVEVPPKKEEAPQEEVKEQPKSLRDSPKVQKNEVCAEEAFPRNSEAVQLLLDRIFMLPEVGKVIQEFTTQKPKEELLSTSTEIVGSFLLDKIKEFPVDDEVRKPEEHNKREEEVREQLLESVYIGNVEKRKPANDENGMDVTHIFTEGEDKQADKGLEEQMPSLVDIVSKRGLDGGRLVLKIINGKPRFIQISDEPKAEMQSQAYLVLKADEEGTAEDQKLKSNLDGKRSINDEKGTASLLHKVL
eukprot:TRINITY_DN7223_c0_g1_i4.p1 TRINITY_DN7223_c0_g1~~TRINITY_DN7223_c0_g1_i4.p1  ORF type:complete len:437 (-),score=124.74 TRINITY_DN7223_c0_g1_i4:205-1515(-)